MATDKGYFEFIAEQLSSDGRFAFRAMMGEYIVYFNGKTVGGIYDNRLLVKPTKSAVALMPSASFELPYEGAKQMLLAEEVDDKDFLIKLFEAVYNDLQ